MIGASVAVVAALLVLILVGRKVLGRRRRDRRRTRRGRHLLHQQLWDQIMTRPRVKRLEHHADARRTPAEE